jgi:hypothetical protein
MKTTFALVLAVASLSAAACDDGGSKTATTTTPAPAASPPPPPPPPPAPAPAAAGIPGLSTPYATEAEWVAACKETGGLDASICECAGKAANKELGAKGLYTWIWEGYIKREGMGEVRSRKWFEDNGFDKPARQKFADAVGKCYVTQK